MVQSTIRPSARVSGKTPTCPWSDDVDLGAQDGAAGQARLPDDGACWLPAVERARDPAEDGREAAAVHSRRAPLGGWKNEPQDGEVVAADRVAAGRRVDLAALLAVEEELDFVLVLHLEGVLDDDLGRGLAEPDQRPVLDRVPAP